MNWLWTGGFPRPIACPFWNGISASFGYYQVTMIQIGFLSTENIIRFDEYIVSCRRRRVVRVALLAFALPVDEILAVADAGRRPAEELLRPSA
ncbi:MAG TPA: hypothetical protein VII49_11230, partial [Rhizomicrobium sp.]